MGDVFIKATGQHLGSVSDSRYTDTSSFILYPTFLPDEATVLSLQPKFRVVNEDNTVTTMSLADRTKILDDAVTGSVKIYDHTSLTSFNAYKPPVNLDFRSGINVKDHGRLEHEKVLTKGDFGDYSSKVYYAKVDTTSSGVPVLTDPVLRRDYMYEYHHSNRWVKKCETIAWYKRDDTTHDTKKNICHHFAGQKYMHFMVEKRGEIIEFLKMWVEQSMGYNAFYNPSSSLYTSSFAELDSKGKSFLGDFGSSISSFVDGGTQDVTGSFTYRLTNDTGSHVWLGDPVTPTIPGGDPTEKIWQFMVSESKYPMS
jgi:hypothetical protein